jgi:transposase-like protein
VEFISRRARANLVELLCDNGWSIADVAGAVGVASQAVYKWLDPRGTHPSNRNLRKLLKLALDADSNRTLDLLRVEAAEFQQLIQCLPNSGKVGIQLGS